MPSIRSGVRAVTGAVVVFAAALTPSVVAVPAGAAVAPTMQVGLDACLGRSPSTTVAGVQTARYTKTFDTATAVDARGAAWTQVDAWPVSLVGTGGICWTGGVIEGTYPATTTWKTFHSTGAFNVANPSATIDNLRVHNYGDGIRLRSGASDWLVRGAYESYLHDDCVENDKLNAGVISQSLFDGCYVAFSARPTSSDTVSDGRARTWRISDSLVRLQPMPTVYKGAAPGHGGFFKWDGSGRSPKLDLQDNVFRVDQLPNHGSLGLPDGYPVTCSGNVIVWLGAGEFPAAASWKAKCPDTVIVTSRAAWDDAVAAWKANEVGAPSTTTSTTSTSTSSTTTSTSTSTTTTTTAPPSTTTTSSPPSTTTTTTAVPPPVGTGSAAPSACLDVPGRTVLGGAQSTRYKPVLSAATAVDARTASWTQVDAWPISINGTGGVCWNGGSVVGTYPDTTTWDTFHSTGAFNVANPDSIIENLTVHNYGDGIRLRDGATHWTIRAAHESYLHDDCIENDRLSTGTVTDSLLDGCYVGMSARPSSSDTTSDGRTHTMTVEGSLVRLQPMPTVYKGPAPGTGGFFKWDDDTGRSPKLSLHDNVFRADQLPNHGSLGLPVGYDVSCSGNVIVWLGAGEFPGAASWKAQCPDTVIVTDRAVWDAAVTGWLARR